MKVVITRGYTWEEGKMAPTPLPLLTVWRAVGYNELTWKAVEKGSWDYVSVDAQVLMQLSIEVAQILGIPIIRGGQAVLIDLKVVATGEESLQENKWGRKNG